MSIKRYNEKRNFSATPEPAGKTVATSKRGALRFVAQKHRASHMHYDFRLELNGVLLSWAVPKGPSLNPDDKRLAMHVEDHPLDYRTFEGTIPEGNYGAGTVMVWDEGTYEADPELSKAENVRQLTADYRKGHLRFVMNGKKLRGRFSLVKMRGSNKYGNDDKAWLLVKADDESADRETPVADQDRSAVTGRTLEQIAADAGAVWESPRKTGSAKKSLAARIAEKQDKAAANASASAATASSPRRRGSSAVSSRGNGASGPKRKSGRGKNRDLAKEALALGGKLSKVPDVSSPQLATLVDAPFDREGWIFEIKWDGYRALGYHPKHDRHALVSRNGLSFDAKFHDIVDALDTLPCAAIVDGEICALDRQGRSSFERLQQHEDAPAELTYCLFDLLYVDGVDIRGLPLMQRKQLLKKLLADCDPRLQYSDHIETHGIDFFEAARSSELEGIIAKDAAATYHSQRTRHWLKIKLEKRQEFLIAGYTAPRRSRSDIGSLLLAYYERKNGKPTGRLRFAGHVGSGMDTETRAELKKKLDRLARKTSPFDERHPTNEPATWVKPELVCEVRFTEKTSDCQLRHPVFIALRTDKPPTEIFWDVAEPAQQAVAEAMQDDKRSDAVSRRRGKRAPAPKAKAKRAPTRRKAAARRPSHPTKTAKSPASDGKSPAVMFRTTLTETDERTARLEGASRYFREEAPVRERPGLPVRVGGVDVHISNPGRLYFPELKLTKLDVVDYYRSVAPLMLPYMKDRPFVLHRLLSGIVLGGYDVEEPELREWITTTSIRSGNGDELRYFVCQNEPTLIYLVNLGCIEMHAWNSRLGTLDRPDFMRFDLDPIDVPFARVVEVACAFHDLLTQVGVPSYCKTSGKRGLHVAVPLNASYDSATVRAVSAAIARAVHNQLPQLTSLEPGPSRSRRKVYIDVMRNDNDKTCVVPYSLRPVAQATVATPLHWGEVQRDLDPREFTFHTIHARIKRVGDPWKGMLTERADLRALQRYMR
ncbi:MAG: DNA ligase D [Gammaproteobacteria bacterium]